MGMSDHLYLIDRAFLQAIREEIAITEDDDTAGRLTLLLRDAGLYRDTLAGDG
jgi:hypothetical protein